MEANGSGIIKQVCIDQLRCSGCGRCVAACPLRLFTLESHGGRKSALIVDIAACTACGKCVTDCPMAAIRLGLAP
ncbi:MAG TPA: 4Fe-4S dicluster domain-containing protein [Deltaproteobacteria bacterium]|nr:4Fe-4S dicluster domain-containing protein [Deltaproteobacteria bacterium]HQB38602.1 4Fe-4S dicluster domain-containing protein [Deltaproteobacteria bacterium]